MIRFLILIAASLSTQAWGSVSITEIKQTAQQISEVFYQAEAQETDFLMLWAGTSEQAMAQQLEFHPTCKNSENYLNESSQQLSSFLVQVLGEKAHLLEELGQKSEADGLRLNAKSLAEKVDSVFSQSQIQVCNDFEGGAYSDGAHVKFVKINGELLFFFGFGRPD